MKVEQTPEREEINSERLEVLQQIEDWLETPMLMLGFAWLVLFVIEVIWGLNRLLEVIGTVIWVIFIADFLLRFTLAPHKLSYLKSNWLTVISLLLPALRVFRIVRIVRLLRATRAVRGLQLVRIVGSLNRGMRALGKSMSRRGFGYVVALTLIVTLVGAAGMYAFERETAPQGGLSSYGAALWWTAMIMTTLGSDYWPQTPEGRVLTLLLALYAFAVFGYVTATLATFFVGRDAANAEAEIASTDAIESLRAEIAALRTDVQSLASSNLDSRSR